MPLTLVRVETANRLSEVTQDAGTILHAFAHSGSSQERSSDNDGFIDNYLFIKDDIPAMLAVGYVGDVATCAATFMEDNRAASEYDNEADKAVVGLAFLGILLLATDRYYRRRGYAPQLVDTVMGLATVYGYDRVQAIWPVDTARKFWEKCGFKDVAFSGTFLDMARETTEPFPQLNIPPAIIGPTVFEKLTKGSGASNFSTDC